MKSLAIAIVVFLTGCSDLIDQAYLDMAKQCTDNGMIPRINHFSHRVTYTVLTQGSKR